MPVFIRTILSTGLASGGQPATRNLLPPHTAHDEFGRESATTGQLGGDAMGGAFTGSARVCDGSDVCDKLDKVFADPTKKIYQKAQDQKDLFLKISQGPGDYKALHDAYLDVGVEDTTFWLDYLSSLEPADIKRLALVRFEALDRTKGMKTKTHNPKKGDGDHHVHFKQEHDLSYTINSPFVPKDT